MGGWGGVRRSTAVAALLVLMAVPARADAPAGGSAAPRVFDPHGLSPAAFDGPVRTSDDRVTAHDGAELVATVHWRGESLDARPWLRPVVLVSTPYDFVLYETVFDASLDRVIDLLTRHGYAVVVASTRGYGSSGGCADLVGPDTAQDLATWVSHLAGAAWANGNVGAYGGSYYGETIKAGLGLAPPSLRTAVLFSTASGLSDFLGTGGVPYWYRGLISHTTSLAFTVFPHDEAPRIDPARALCQPDNLGIVNVDGEMSDYYRTRDYRLVLPDVRASVLELLGMQDFFGYLYAWDEWFDALPSFHRGVIGQWAHEAPARGDYLRMLHAWFDAELLGLPTGIDAWPVLQVEAIDGSWRAVPSFAGLSAGHIVYDIPTLAAAPRHAMADPWSWTEASLSTANPLSLDRTLAGHVEFETTALAEPLHLSGIAEMTAPIRIDRDEAHFVLHVEAVFRDGTTALLARGALSARHRESFDAPTPVPVHDWVGYRISTHAFDAQLPAGTVLRFRIGSADDEFAPEGNGYTATLDPEDATVRLPIADDSNPLVIHEGPD